MSMTQLDSHTMATIYDISPAVQKELNKICEQESSSLLSSSMEGPESKSPSRGSIMTFGMKFGERSSDASSPLIKNKSQNWWAA